LQDSPKFTQIWNFWFENIPSGNPVSGLGWRAVDDEEKNEKVHFGPHSDGSLEGLVSKGWLIKILCHEYRFLKICGQSQLSCTYILVVVHSMYVTIPLLRKWNSLSRPATVV
jgi:hypothetical protein